MDDAQLENTGPETIVEEIIVESVDPASTESSACTDGQNKVSSWLTKIISVHED